MSRSWRLGTDKFQGVRRDSSINLGSRFTPLLGPVSPREGCEGVQEMNWHEWLKENLRPDQFERLDAYDMQILVSLHKRAKRARERQKPMPPEFPRPIMMGTPNAIWMDVHGEMGGITEVQIYERLKKLSDMALLRVYATFNREMPEKFE